LVSPDFGAEFGQVLLGTCKLEFGGFWGAVKVVGVASMYSKVYVGTREFPAHTPKTRCTLKHLMVALSF
jgi:hypothetical protein